MNKLNTIQIGGVPEHFNAPWRYAIEKGIFEAHDLAVEFTEYPTGTGAMCAALDNRELDMAVVLTEGIIQHIENKQTASIIAPYVVTPLNWGIHVAAQSDIACLDDLQGKTFAISRKGSGSHLMSLVLAKKLAWSSSDAINFHVAGGLENLCQAVNQNAHAFLWEVFTTKPCIERGLVKCIDVLPTPWPCFQIAANQEFIQEHHVVIDKLLAALFPVLTFFNQKTPEIIDIITRYYSLAPSEIKAWLTTVEWNQGAAFEPSIVKQVKRYFSL